MRQVEYVALPGELLIQTVQTAVSVTMNSPASMSALFTLAAGDSRRDDQTSTAKAVTTAELMREVGLKCISFNGIPRSINCLNGFRDSLPTAVASQLSKTATRGVDSADGHGFDEIIRRGQRLWVSIYDPLDTKLYEKVARAHPDLPIIILQHHYGALLSDPRVTTAELGHGTATPCRVGRVLTSIVAICCLRAQTGCGPQLLSHVYGLKKALADGSYTDGFGPPVTQEASKQEALKWLLSDEGIEWILQKTDELIGLFQNQGEGDAPQKDSKL